MKQILALLLLVSIFGCKVVSCPFAETIADGASAFMAKAGDCDEEGEKLLRSDIMAFLDSEGSCTKPAPAGPIAMFACPILSKLVNNAIWNSKGPKRYHCKGGNAKIAMEWAMTAGCNLIPF